MSNINSATKITETTSKLFICHYSVLFNSYLSKLDDNAKHIIRNNAQLNELYDLFLDFIIDSNQHLDYHNAIQQIKEIQDVGSN
jgi:hypothetical protein